VKLLLDTHLLLWAGREPERLSAAARKLISDAENELIFSAVSIWEAAIKSGLNRPTFRTDARILRRNLIDNGYTELPLKSEHVAAIDILPPIHTDPFDRVLVAQAIVEGITLLTSDRQVSAYPGPIKRL
jgi:PIN domain nuclease of toxin-antitoxin system